MQNLEPQASQGARPSVNQGFCKAWAPVLDAQASSVRRQDVGSVARATNGVFQLAIFAFFSPGKYGYPPGHKFSGNKLGQIHNVVSSTHGDSQLNGWVQERSSTDTIQIMPQQYQILAYLFKQSESNAPNVYINQVRTLSTNTSLGNIVSTLQVHLGNTWLLDYGATDHAALCRRHNVKRRLNGTPHDRLHGSPCDLSMLRIFCCLCYANTITAHRKKFDDRVHTKGYLFLNLKNHNVDVSYNVVFHENVFPYQNIHKTDNSLSLPLPTNYTHNYDDLLLFGYTTADLPFGHPVADILFGHTAADLPFGHPVADIPFGHTASDIPIGSHSTSTDITQIDDTGNDTSTSVRHSSRPRKLPAYLKDFKTNSIANNTWVLMTLPLIKLLLVVIGFIKLNTTLMARLTDIKHIEGLDYLDTFAPVAKLTTLPQSWSLKKLDVNNVFLHGDLHKDVYMKVPPGLTFVVNHLTATCILRYLKGTPSVGIFLAHNSTVQLKAFCDSDWDTCPDTCRSVTGFAVYLGSSLFSWRSKKQPTVSHSSFEVEYRSLADTICELQWLTYLLHDLQVAYTSPALIYCDNQSAIQIAFNQVFHERIKHIDIDCHIIREKVFKIFTPSLTGADNNFTVRSCVDSPDRSSCVYTVRSCADTPDCSTLYTVRPCTSILLPISTTMQIADILTKLLPLPSFQLLRSKLGLQNIYAQLEEADNSFTVRSCVDSPDRSVLC
ncbi:hypothetical protein V8G54_027200 [Vigna mungo]|uniref:Reverse transcriptase Ty1/copia-type domain-containing protein n=1 Tax=Vigna mungo TaxID=3915 RepID=A0AAQ3N2E9_VIGMU